MIIYAISTDDSANINVPGDFPGTIGLVSDKIGKISWNTGATMKTLITS